MRDKCTTRVATFLRQADGFMGDARVFRLDPPFVYVQWGADSGVMKDAEYVVVSGVVATFSGPETYIFQSDEDGDVTSWVELKGSFRGAIDHAEALRGMGYEVAE